MRACRQDTVWLLLITINLAYAENGEKEVLEEAEAKDGKLEIVKQIKKVNDDGSYTIGYEADDGSFKIESRDVLGNIKGTYGYLDNDGEIKRVSYSTNNNSAVTTEIPETETPSVVQRIPRTNRTHHGSPTTRRPAPAYTTTPASGTVIQSIPRRRETLVTTSSTTTKPATYIASSPSRSQPLPSRVLLRSTAIPATNTQKSEGQLLRPEIATELPIFRRPIPVSEEHEVRGNLIRRQLSQEKEKFDARQHVLNLQQGFGDDAGDVYGGSVSTGTPRPLFTTTARSKSFLNATPTTHRSLLPLIKRPETNQAKENADFAQESSTESAVANNENVEQLVAIRHPLHGGTILVPLGELRAQQVPVYQHQQQFLIPNEQYHRELYPNQQIPRPIIIREPEPLRSMPVKVDENGFVREYGSQNFDASPYQVPVPVAVSTQATEYKDIDSISPPVSIKDFQMLLEQLILRQSRLEQIRTLTRDRSPPAFNSRYRPVYQPTQAPVFVQKFVTSAHVQKPQQQQLHPVIVRPQPQPHDVYSEDQYAPTKRVARLLRPQLQHENYLPPNVREMLLLRMLQLAINPALPLDPSDNEESMDTTAMPHFRKEAVRNVEILGEEEEEYKGPSRTKRYRKVEEEYLK